MTPSAPPLKCSEHLGGASVSVVIPALNEEATVAQVIAAVEQDDPTEIIVIDSDSEDRTAARAAAAGARVLNWREIHPAIAPHPGKGEALWRGLAAARGDYVVFVDADLQNPPPHLVRRLLAPLADPGIHLVKAAYRRPLGEDPHGGGRVTELTAKPLLRILHPELGHISQPLAGEYALRRPSARACSFIIDFGVEIGIMLDIAARFGPAAIAEADLGVKRHKHRPLQQLAHTADSVARVLLERESCASRPPLESLGVASSDAAAHSMPTTP
ncbi:glucosyl-3-phosphoglycerate synthase [Corynebacterium sp. TAE3-ERU30]|uniref:glucosyl-3-phosphoglycerate synthase n=1 Tax=Corynebacterium sp. TAE3-ERU30 TaxID=2849496 RepID=UPI001C46F2FF|nr:glucosyl-3-phosphoglycerate synthase [Corynebacterium sp. TAE3-ERU30]MBV7281573.1 glucosyl-3-phosphoglycerate synthase [Corynebacterium sp. TAE3-ERU30]